MSQPTAETVKAAEQRVRAYLAKRAGRTGDAEVARLEREPFGKQAPLDHRYSAEAYALFYEIGFWYPHGRDYAVQQFVEATADQQVFILSALVKHSQKHKIIYDATDTLLSEFGSGRHHNSNPRLAVIWSEFSSNVSRPQKKRGPDPTKLTGRNALILSIMQVLKVEFPTLSIVENSATQSESDACSIVERILNDEFPNLNLAKGAVRNVWEQQVGKKALRHTPASRDLTDAERQVLLAELEALREASR